MMNVPYPELVKFAKFIGFEATAEELVAAYFKSIRVTNITETQIFEVVARYHNIEPYRMLVHAKPMPVLEPRQICMMLIYEVLKYSDTQVGVIFKKNRVTVLHAVMVVHDRIETNKKYREKFINIAHDIGLSGEEINKLITTRPSRQHEKNQAKDAIA